MMHGQKNIKLSYAFTSFMDFKQIILSSKSSLQ